MVDRDSELAGIRLEEGYPPVEAQGECISLGYQGLAIAKLKLDDKRRIRLIRNWKLSNSSQAGDKPSASEATDTQTEIASPSSLLKNKFDRLQVAGSSRLLFNRSCSRSRESDEQGISVRRD